VNRRHVILWLQVGAAALLVLGLGGCGRKGALDPPPSSLSQAVPATDQPEGTPDNPPPPRAETKKPLPMDWLLR
jgi:predicted small lipoprotein YifL